MADFYSRELSRVQLLGDAGTGWRSPQIGALGAIMAHWSLSDGEPTVVSIPTGSGKTAIALAAPFLLREPPQRVLVLAPGRHIRRQLFENFSTYRQLERLGVFTEAAVKPVVFEMTGLATDWTTIQESDVVVALPNSISPVHYADDARPPRDLFDLIIIDEAHHSPAETWLAVLKHFEHVRALLLTATPRRRDGKRLPGSLEYYYPLRRALDEGFYKPIVPLLLMAPDPQDRGRSDAAIARQAANLMTGVDHRSSVLLVRAGSIARLDSLRATYADVGIDLRLLHNRMSERDQTEVVRLLKGGEVRAVGVVGMLGEGFDLPSIRIAAYHDKHRSLPATVQLIGRLARVDPRYPQPSCLITVADADVFPELKGVVRELYQEDADWSEVLPGVIDDEIQQARVDRAFAERLPASSGEIDPIHLRPTKRAIVYELPADWEPAFLTTPPPQLAVGAKFRGGTIVYSGADVESGMLIVAVRYVDRPKWSTDPGLVNIVYELHVVAHRRPPRTDLPGLLLLNLDSDGVQATFEEILGLEGVARLAGPERIGDCLDSLNRVSVSSVGVRSTNAATRGRATYKNFLGGGVDRGLRSVDLARSALGHVMFQIDTGTGAINAGGAVEKSKLWLMRHGELRELRDWVDEVTALLWFPKLTTQGPLLPGVDRGRRLDSWPASPPLAAEMYPGLLGLGFELFTAGQRLGALEDLDLYVNDDPTGTLHDVGTIADPVRLIGVLNDRANDDVLCVWDGAIHLDGRVTATRDLEVRRGYGGSEPLSTVLRIQPPTIYFLDGTTTIGPVRYDSRRFTSAIDLGLLQPTSWNGVDIEAETDRTTARKDAGKKSVHNRLHEYLRSRSRSGANRWIIFNDGAGEIADYVVVEELGTGEVELALWHAKAAHGRAPSVRVQDFQEVVAQAIRSRRQFPSTTIWSELAARLEGRSQPVATLMHGSDDIDILREKLGLVGNDESAWTRRHPVVRGRLGIVQPGLSAGQFRTELDEGTDAAQSLRQLFSVLADVASSDGAALEFVVSI